MRASPIQPDVPALRSSLVDKGVLHKIYTGPILGWYPVEYARLRGYVGVQCSGYLRTATPFH